VIDFAAALTGMIVLSPVIAAVAASVRLSLGSPVFFRQQRPGRYGRPFTLVKFRTMSNERSDRGQLLPDSERITRLGRFLRKTSLDELPQLWNVLTGDLSLVGPRPLLMQYLDRYTPFQRRRHEVSPGITGWAQVNGRNAITWEEKFAMDVWYVDNRSLRLDFRIMIMTFVQVIRRKGISQDGRATVDEFMGTEEK